MAWPLSQLGQPFPIPTAFFVNVDREANIAAAAASFSPKKTSKKLASPSLSRSRAKNKSSGKVIPLMGWPDSDYPVIISRPASAPSQSGGITMAETTPSEVPVTQKDDANAHKIAELLSADRPTVILTIIFERIAKKNRDADIDAHGHIDEKKRDIFTTLLANPAHSSSMPIPVSRLNLASKDWLYSNVLLESLVDEDDTVHMELTILFRAVCESDKKVEALSPTANKILESHYLNALRLLHRLHEDLRCPIKAHHRFWTAHNTVSSASLVSILSRLCHLNKSRNLLIDIFRLAAKLSTYKENGFLNFSHFPAPKRPIKLLDVNRRKSFMRGRARTLMQKSELAAASGQAMGGTNGDTMASVVEQAHTAHEHHKHGLTAFFGQAPAAIRESARKSIKISNELSVSRRNSSIYNRWSMLSRFSSNDPMVDPSNSSSSNKPPTPSKILAALHERFEEDEYEDSAEDEEEEEQEEGEDDDDRYEDDFFEDEPNIATAKAGGATPDKQGMSPSRMTIGRKTTFATPPQSGSSASTPKRATTAIVNPNIARSTMMSTRSGQYPQQQLHNRSTKLVQITSTTVSGDQVKFNKAAEERVLKTWIDEWSHSLPWKVDSFTFGAVEMLKATEE